MEHFGSVSRLSDASVFDLATVDPPTRFGIKDTHSEPLSLLIISTMEFCEILKSALNKVIEEQYGGKICIKLAESMKQVFESGIEATSLDYVAIVSDTTITNWMDQIEENLALLGSLVTTKVCLVNGSPKTGLEGSALDFVRLAERHSLLYITGQLKEKASMRVADRLLYLSTTCCGFFTGIPFTFPTPLEFIKLY